jgi:hypothetical protein
LRQGLPIIVATTSEQKDPTPLQWMLDGNFYWIIAQPLSGEILTFMRGLILQYRTTQLCNYTLTYHFLTEEEKAPYYTPTFSMANSPVRIVEGNMFVVMKDWLNLNAIDDSRLTKIRLHHFGEMMKNPVTSIPFIHDRSKRFA